MSYTPSPKDSVRAYKERHKIGRFADVDPVLEAQKANEFQELAEKIQVGDRCVVDVGGMQKRASVRYDC